MKCTSQFFSAFEDSDGFPFHQKINQYTSLESKETVLITVSAKGKVLALALFFRSVLPFLALSFYFWVQIV
jgi:hypothetical protein